MENKVIWGQDGWLQIVQGDITRLQVDAIVNAANSDLRAGSGVCGAIYRAAGYERLKEETEKIGRCSTGKAVVTPACDLTETMGIKHVIHAVGPIYQDGFAGEEILLRSAYNDVLKHTRTLRLDSVAIPFISAGVYGYPKHEAAWVGLTAALRDRSAHVGYKQPRVVFCTFLEEDFHIFKDTLASLM